LKFPYNKPFHSIISIQQALSFKIFHTTNFYACLTFSLPN
jgi:hypothetical protein